MILKYFFVFYSHLYLYVVNDKRKNIKFMINTEKKLHSYSSIRKLGRRSRAFHTHDQKKYFFRVNYI